MPGARMCYLLPLRRPPIPIDKPLDFRFAQTHASVLHGSCPKSSVADQAAERCERNTKAFGGLAVSEDFVARIRRIGVWQAALPASWGSLYLSCRTAHK